MAYYRTHLQKMDKVCQKAILKNDLSIVLKKCREGIGTSSIIEWIPRQPYYENGYVYFLMQGSEVVYIGASGDRHRIGAHKKNKVFDSFCYFLCGNFEHWKLETLLINNFETRYNKQKKAIKSVPPLSI